MKSRILAMLTLLVSTLIFAAGKARAGQVLISCNLNGYQDVESVQVTRLSTGRLETNVFMVGVRHNHYSLPVPQVEPKDFIDLSYFNTFNDLDRPRLEIVNRQWVFAADGLAPRVVHCASFRD